MAKKQLDELEAHRKRITELKESTKATIAKVQESLVRAEQIASRYKATTEKSVHIVKKSKKG